MSKAQGKFDFSVHHPFKTCKRCASDMLKHVRNMLKHPCMLSNIVAIHTCSVNLLSNVHRLFQYGGPLKRLPIRNLCIYG